MTGTRSVVLYGDSIVLASVAAVLMQQENMRVHKISADCDWGTAAEPLEPDVVLFDLAAFSPNDLLCMLVGSPIPRLVGIDLSQNRLLVLFCQEVEGVAVSSLMQAIY
jgi:hypothetical protein